MLGLSAATFISRAITLIIAFTFHEFSHAYIADTLGDGTPRANGRLTLNPLAHLDVMGALMLLVGGFGWAKPVPVNPYALRRRSSYGMMLVAAAGPLSNLLLAILAAIPIRAGLVDLTSTSALSSVLPTLPQFLITFIIVNLSLMLFNLIPIPPLDGDAIAEAIFPPNWQRVLDRIRPYGPVLLLVLVFLLPTIGIDVLGWIMGPPLRAIFGLLVGG